MRIRDERLPWLTDEPVPEVAGPAPGVPAPAPAKTPTRAMWPWYLLLALLVAAVATGGWWLGTRQVQAPPPELPVEAPIAIPVTSVESPPTQAPAELPPEPVLVDERFAQLPAAPRAEPVRAPSAAVPAEAAPGPVPSGEEPVGDSVATATTVAPVAPAAGRGVFPADEPTAIAAPVTGPRPIVVYHPQRDRGRVVQLGAFPSRTQAEETWRRVTRRYPYLASKPKMVNTVDVRVQGSARRTRMYRLQLGTSSQAQAAVICQQLERAGQSCVVVY